MENQSENFENSEEKKVEAEGGAEEQQAEPIAADKEEKNSKIDYKEKYFYLAAEMENMRKRFEREKDSLVKYSMKSFGDLMEVVDNFERKL
ncbi:MAG: nucleotide exchange factor GrpE [Bacteriovoracaceae bacterium]